MRRLLESKLLDWWNRRTKRPLILRGARQVGKSWLMKWLGENHYEKMARFNFE